MDAQKFGAFVAETRRENNMTQRELAQKLLVTDKAVSRWERGLGFPDINTLEPLAQALGITVVELMRCEKNPAATVTKEEASLTVVDTVQAARQQWKRALKRFTLLLAGVLAAVGLWFFLTGMVPRTDVYLGEYAVLHSGDAVAIRVGLAGPMGYIRSCSDVNDEPGEVCLRFYSAFGGLNSSLGAQNLFLIPLEEDCTEIYFEGRDVPVLRKNAAGEWERARTETTAGEVVHEGAGTP